ncbi:MAG TPA: TGS domain-containing protein [bacterium]|nr:TGS domain-containing protein [bacterium]
MPANLTPEYMAADKKFKAAATPRDKLAALEEMLATIPKHKGTEKMQADLKRRIAKLRNEVQQRKKGAARGKPFYQIDKEGAGQIVLVGGPNVGKSMLLGAVTNAEPEVADYPFTTRVPQPGMCTYENVQFQMVDLPPIAPEFAEGWLYGIIRTADAAVIVVDLAADDLLSDTSAVLDQLGAANIRLVPGAPDVPGEKRAFAVANKLDVHGAGDRLAMLREFLGQLPVLPVSAVAGTGLDSLREQMFELLDVIRVYSKPPGKKVDLSAPFILRRGATVLDAADAIHKDFVAKLKYARLWGGETYQGQMVGRDHVLKDGDILELHA